MKKLLYMWNHSKIGVYPGLGLRRTFGKVFLNYPENFSKVKRLIPASEEHHREHLQFLVWYLVLLI